MITGRPRKPRPPCAWCGQPVKLLKNLTCSRSCGCARTWERLRREGRAGKFIEAQRRVKWGRYIERIKAECAREAAKLELAVTPALVKFYVRARSIGYNTGYQARARREGNT